MNIDILGDRFVGMFKEDSANGVVLRLEVDFTSKINGLKWMVFNKKDSREVDIIYTMEKNGNSKNDIYHVIGMEGAVSFDDLIKHSKQIIEFNMEVEEKKIMLKQKFDELGELFAKYPIEILRTLEFRFVETIKAVPAPLPKKSKKPRKKIEEVVEAISNVYLEEAQKPEDIESGFLTISAQIED